MPINVFVPARHDILFVYSFFTTKTKFRPFRQQKIKNKCKQAQQTTVSTYETPTIRKMNLKEAFTQEKKEVFSNHPVPSGTLASQMTKKRNLRKKFHFQPCAIRKSG